LFSQLQDSAVKFFTLDLFCGIDGAGYSLDLALGEFAAEASTKTLTIMFETDASCRATLTSRRCSSSRNLSEVAGPDGSAGSVLALGASDFAHLYRTLDRFPNLVSMLVIERERPGFEVSRKLDKMGWWASDTAELSFSGCRVPASQLVGGEGSGFAAIMANFVTERLYLAGQCVAIAALALRESLQYTRDREAFGKPLTGFQVTRHKLAEMATRIAAARALTGEVASRLISGAPNPALAAMAKNTATDMCSWVVDQAVQLHGGYGYMREYVVERLYRDARLYPLGGGTREIMLEIVGKSLGL
jgi:alkylation response protein AidB-like acyl-CoA dehydrogenase